MSAHYLIGLDGRVAQLVDEADTARHAGRVKDPTASLLAGGNPNLHTIGIEFEDGGDPDGVKRPDAQYRAGARLLAEIAGRWGIPLDRDHVVGHRELFSAKACPGNLDVERLISEAGAAPLLTCLVPVRNGAGDLAGWLDSMENLADAVVALDDGSTDETAELLEASPLVRRVISNPRRRGFAGWDDGANRARLLEAAGELGYAGWLAFIDVDERIDAEDARALRAFLASDGLPGCAYGLQLHRMWGELVVPGHTWVYRVFASAPGQRPPPGMLHQTPVPEAIPRSAWIRTSIRLRHLDSPERLRERRAKYREADPRGEFEARGPRLLEQPEGDLERWPRRDPDAPVLEASGPTAAARPAPGRDRPLLLCLLPVRNGERDLPAYLESVARFADGVVALDDGSTDATAELLAASPQVLKLIGWPRREGYQGWDDAGNRARLLAAAAELDPEWVIWLDADERIDPADAVALRDFVEQAAEPGCAYGFRVFRMIEDLGHYDEAGLWVYRLFAYRPGQELPERRLHFVPVPESIPRSRWRRTTIRIQHAAGLTDERRRARLRKYEQADPDRDYQRDYEYLTRGPSELKEWRARPPGFPVLADPLGRGFAAQLDLETLDLDAPLLSAIVISRDDEDRIERAVRSVVEQESPRPFEVIVVVSGTDRTAEIVRERFPQVRLVELEGEALPGRARNAGVAAARGDYVSFPGSHVELPPGSLAARIEAHERGHAMVTGSILNGTETRSGWASYFLDHSGSLPGRPSGPLAAPPAHCSYVREFVLEAGGFPEDLRAGEDTVVNRRLFARGHRAYRAREVALVHRSRCSTPLRLVRHHYARGRSWGRIMLEDHRGGPRLLRPRSISFLLRYPFHRVRRVRGQVRAWGGDLRSRCRGSLPLIVAGTLAAWAGLWRELLSPGRGKLRIMFADERPWARWLSASADEDELAVDARRDRVGPEGLELPG